MSVKLVERGGSERYRDFKKSAEGSDLYRSKEKENLLSERWPISLLGEGFPEYFALVFRLPFRYRCFFFFPWIGLSQGWPTCKREKSEASLIGRHKSPRAFAKNPKLKTSKAFWCFGYFPPCSDGKVSVKILTSFARVRTPIHYLSLWRFLSLAGWDVFHTLNLLNEASSDLSSKCKVSIISRNLALEGVPRWPSS